jgi:hypothetical protein
MKLTVRRDFGETADGRWADRTGSSDATGLQFVSAKEPYGAGRRLMGAHRPIVPRSERFVPIPEGAGPMKKLSLDLDQLAVDSFDTVSDVARRAGTRSRVHRHHLRAVHLRLPHRLRRLMPAGHVRHRRLRHRGLHRRHLSHRQRAHLPAALVLLQQPLRLRLGRHLRLLTAAERISSPWPDPGIVPCPALCAQGDGARHASGDDPVLSDRLRRGRHPEGAAAPRPNSR